jgi:methylmalonyl-CoA mutase
MAISDKTQSFEEFPPVSKAEWLAKVEKDLKGKPISDLDFEVGEIKMSPFHHLDDFKKLPKPLPANNGWEIGEDITVTPNLIETNKSLLAALEAGINAPRLVLNQQISAEDLAILLNKVDVEIISTQFYFINKNNTPQHFLSCFKKYVSENNFDLKKVNIGINWAGEDAVEQQEIIHLLGQLKNGNYNVKALPVNGLPYFSENNPAHELAAILKKGENFIKQYSSSEFSPEFINQHLFFSVAIGKNYFLQIAKIRALNLLWANVMQSYQINFGMPTMEAHLAPTSQSEDENTNMIAATTQAMSAIIGGANRLTVLPADAFKGTNSSFSKRIARNVQHLLQGESYFGRVEDPAAGSYYIEKLTQELAEKAWEVFQKSC